MTNKEWDAHERLWCSLCAHERRGRHVCPIKHFMHEDPNDAQASFFVQQGQCTQFEQKTKKAR